MSDQEDDSEFQDDDDRANVLAGNRTSLLYFWHMTIQHDFLSQTVNILPNDLSATTDNVSPVSRKSKVISLMTLLTDSSPFQEQRVHV